MLLSEDWVIFVKGFQDENLYVHFMAMDFHWSHVASVSN